MNNNDAFNVPKVSVIIPIYKVEKYIEKCARSLFEQTLDNMEYIFIDDCSPDNSVMILKKIIQEYPIRIPQTTILKMPSNAGIAGVRKRGIMESKGIFIIHCDGDDWVDNQLYEKMYNKAQSEKADVIICDFIYDYLGNQVKVVSNFNALTGHQLIKNWHKKSLHLSTCNKLIRSSLYKENHILPWEGLNMWEDNGLVARLLYHSNKISKIEGSYYHYNRTNENAMTSGYGINQVNQMIDIASNLADFFNSKPDAEEFQDTISAFKYLARINLVTDSFKNYKRFLKTFPESKYIARKLDSKAFSSKGKVRFNMVRFGLAPLFILLFKLYNRLHS